MTEEEKEFEQLDRLNAMRKIAQAMFLKWLWLIIPVFVIAAAATEYYIQGRILHSPRRYFTETKLMFTPKSVPKIKTMDAKEVLQILERVTTFRKYGDLMNMTPEERSRAAQDIEIKTDKYQKNLITITAYAPDGDTAIARANAFAELCIREYAAYRSQDLESWIATLNERKKEIQNQLDNNDAAESALSRKYGVTAPSVEADRLSRTLSDRNGEFSEMKVQLAALELKRRKLEAEIATLPTNAIANAVNIRRRAERVEKLQEELSVLESQYTEKNPRLSTRKAQVEAEKAAYREYLKSIGAEDIPMEKFLHFDTVETELKDALAKEEMAREACEAMERERERLSKQISALLEVAPEFDRIQHQRDNYRASLNTVDDDISNVRYLVSAVANDLSRVDPAQIATGTSPWSKKGIVVALAAGGALAGLLAMLLIFWELSFGRVRSSSEIALAKEFLVLGGLPKGSKYSSEKEQKAVTDSIYYRFRSGIEDPGVIFVGVLAGGIWDDQIRESFNWNFAMSGVSLVGIKVLDAEDFEEPKNARELGGTYIADGGALFPVADASALSPSELELLKTDIATLREEGAIVFIYRDKPFHRANLFLEQMLRFCDTSAFAVGVRATRRALLSRIVDLERKHPERKMPVLATGIADRADFKEINFR